MSEAPEKKVIERQYCTICENFGHSDDTCPKSKSGDFQRIFYF